MKITCFLLVSLIAFAYAEICKDVSDSGACAAWDKFYKFCKRSDAGRYCKKTCGLCKTRPTQPPKTRTKYPPMKTTKAPPQPQCGRSVVPQSRIINGVNAKPGAWPWIVSLQRYTGHFCGGTLLTPKWVLTASHCADIMTPSNLHTFTVNLGVHDRRNKEGSVQRIRIKRVTKHPQYSRGTLYADIAILELETPAKLNDRVRLACLPKEGVYPAIGKQCYLAGWGSIAHPGRSHHTLQQTKLPVVSSASCRWQKEVVCVGNGFDNQPDGKQQPNACRGDSGGPLVCQQSDGRWQLEGVASYVYTYCKYYTGYSPVNKYMSWINSFISQ